MKRLVGSACVIAFVLAACGDNKPSGAIDGGIDSPPIDMGTIDSSDIDAPIDAMPTPAERIVLARALPDGTTSFGIVDATITYIKPVITGANVNNDPGGFTIQVDPTGPALMIEADVTMLTPTPAVGDVVSFTIGEMKTAGTNGAGVMRRGAMITNYTRTTAATNVAPLVQDITAIANVTAMVGDFESELVDVTAATIAEAWGNSGSAFQRTRITTAGVTAINNDFQLRIPQTFKESLETTYDLEVGCVVAIHRTPVNRFAAQFQVSAFNATDLTVTSCPTPTVATATATAATTVTVTFSRNIDTATVMANGSQFTITETATPANTLAVTAATLSAPNTITLTTAAQTSGTSYTVTVANTVEDVTGGAIGTPNSAAFTGFAVVIPTVMMAAATAATTVNVTFTRNIDMTSVMPDGSQFTIVDNATPTPNTLTVTAASVSGMVVTLTTAAQTSGTMYTVTVANTVEDTSDTPVGAPLSANFLGYTPTAAANHLVISELDYDLVGTDTNGEFVEIYNPTAAAISLTGLRVVFVNGATTTAPALYATNPVYDLSALTSLDPGQYLVLGPAMLVNGLPVTVKKLAMTGNMDLIQQGPRDSVFLVNVGDAGASIAPTIVDSITYEGNTSANLTYDAAGQSIVLVPEGASGVDDSDTVAGSLCRSPDGVDTNSNAADIKRCTASTPGAANTL